MATNPRTVAAAYAIRRSIETGGGPGLAVNAHPNPFFLGVNGSIDLYRTAELVLEAVDSYDRAKAAADEKSRKEAPAPVADEPSGSL